MTSLSNMERNSGFSIIGRSRNMKCGYSNKRVLNNCYFLLPFSYFDGRGLIEEIQITSNLMARLLAIQTAMGPTYSSAA